MRKWQVLLVVALLASLSLAFGRTGAAQSKMGAGRFGNIAAYIRSMPKEELSDEEVQMLIKMVEEEKLARDVYAELYEVWKVPAFERISESEQVHMDAVRALIDKYGLEDPAEGKKAGEFEDEDIAALYNELVEKGKKSLEEAFEVGITIEKMDIEDLEKALKVVDNEDVKMVFENLKNGSENHFGAFSRLMSGNNGQPSRTGKKGGRGSYKGYGKRYRGRR